MDQEKKQLLDIKLSNDIAEFRWKLMEALIYLMSCKGRLLLPSLYEYITSALFEGWSQHVLEEPFLYPYRDNRSPFIDWEEKYNEFLDKILVRDRKTIEVIREAMHKMLVFRQVYCPPDRPYYVNETREYARMPYWNPMKSTFAVSASHAEKSEEFLNQLSSTTREWCEKVAEHASRAVEADLAYIREHYHW